MVVKLGGRSLHLLPWRAVELSDAEVAPRRASGLRLRLHAGVAAYLEQGAWSGLGGPSQDMQDPPWVVSGGSTMPPLTPFATMPP
jgi:hypothetical protein